MFKRGTIIVMVWISRGVGQQDVSADSFIITVLQVYIRFYICLCLSVELKMGGWVVVRGE